MRSCARELAAIMVDYVLVDVTSLVCVDVDHAHDHATGYSLLECVLCLSLVFLDQELMSVIRVAHLHSDVIRDLNVCAVSDSGVTDREAKS